MPLNIVPGGLPQANTYVPMLYTAKTISAHLETTVFKAIVNTKYENEFSYGDTLTIPYGMKSTVKEYTIGQDIDFERPTTETTTFTIDKGLYVAAVVDDVQDKQSMLDRMSEWSKHNGHQFARAQDIQILNDVAIDADAFNRGVTAGKESGSFNLGATGSPVSITPANIIDFIADCNTVLKEQSVSGDTFLLLPNLFVNMLYKALGSNSYYDGAKQVLENGKIPVSLSGFKIYETQGILPVNDPSGVKAYSILFGTTNAITYAVQMNKTSSGVPIERFEKVQKQLMIYGYKVIVPEELGVLYAYKG